VPDDKRIVRKRGEAGDGRQGFMIFCPGCKCGHVFYTVNPGGPTWSFNNNFERPTFTPSLLIKEGHYADGKHPCWCDYNKEHPDKPGPSCRICHSVVTDGQIAFCGDSTHELANKTVPLEAF
jgi:hypothetical protein